MSQFYALDIGGMNLILAYFTHTLSIEEKNLIPCELIRRYKNVRNLTLLVAAIFVVSILPPFWTHSIETLPLRIILWLITFPLIWASRWIILVRRAHP